MTGIDPEKQKGRRAAAPLHSDVTVTGQKSDPPVFWMISALRLLGMARVYRPFAKNASFAVRTGFAIFPSEMTTLFPLSFKHFQYNIADFIPSSLRLKPQSAQ